MLKIKHLCAWNGVFTPAGNSFPMKNLLLILFTCGAFAVAEAQWVVTVAGVLETPGFNDGNALSSRFFNPHGIAIDSAGMVYVADRYNHTIRKFDPHLQLVSTLAGKPGETGDADGPGEDARFHEPWGICATPGGTVYIADTKNNKIRMLTPDGMVSTVGGTGNSGTTDGPGSAATFGEPTGIEVNDEGILYVADHRTHIIRKIEDGVVSTLAGFPYIPGDADGTGNEAQFWRPYGLTLDNYGNILVADEWNHKIRRVTPEGVVTTVAGMGEIGLTNGAAEEARFHFPWDVTVDDNDNIYVADGYNYVIRRIATDGTVTSFAGTPQVSGGQDGIGEDASFSGATSIAWSAKDTAIYVGDAYNHLVRAIYIYGLPSPTVTLSIVAGSTQLCGGGDVTLTAFPDYYSEYKFYLGGQAVQEGDGTEFSLSDLSPGEYSLYVVAQADAEVVTSNTVTITVSEPPLPTISAVGPTSFYEGDSVILVANGTGGFLWSNGSAEQTITVYESGTYFVEETIGACTGMSGNVVVDVTELPDGIGILLEGDPVLCPGETALLSSSIPFGNQWLKDGWPITGATSTFIEVSESGTYQVQATDLTSGVTVVSEGQEITAVPDSDFDFEASPRIGYPGQRVSFSSVGMDTPVAFSWNFGDSQNTSENTSTAAQPQHTYDEIGDYTVGLEATDGYDCVHLISKNNFIQIVEDGTPVGGIYLPSAFTPNNDGMNDVFRVRGAITGDFAMSVFNQWGERIFYSESPNYGWDGNRYGRPVDSGTYTYLATAETPEGRQVLSGNITLLR